MVLYQNWRSGVKPREPYFLLTGAADENVLHELAYNLTRVMNIVGI
jgi:hypothetical protein